LETKRGSWKQKSFKNKNETISGFPLRNVYTIGHIC
jgi:hypothetical protein